MVHKLKLMVNITFLNVFYLMMTQLQMKRNRNQMIGQRRCLITAKFNATDKKMMHNYKKNRQTSNQIFNSDLNEALTVVFMFNH